jgi:hypothetical protein
MKYIIAFLFLCGVAVGGPNAQRFLVLDSAKPDNVWSQTFTRGESVWLRCDLYARGAVYTNPCGGYLWYATNAAASTGVKIYSSYNEPGFVWFLVSSSNSLGLSSAPASHYSQVVITNADGTVFADWGRGTFVTRNGGGVTGVGVAPSVTNINIGTYSWQGVFPAAVIPAVPSTLPAGAIVATNQGVVGQSFFYSGGTPTGVSTGYFAPGAGSAQTQQLYTAQAGTAQVAVVATTVTGPQSNLIATAWQNPASATNWTWTSDGSEITLTGYTGPNAVVIPDMLDGLPVTGIGNVFTVSLITSVSGGANVATIGGNAFFGCTALTSVSLPSATTFVFSAFFGCTALTSVSLPSATTIGSNTFRDCPNLTAVYFGQNAPAEATDVYANAPNVTNYVTSPTATGWGAIWNSRPVLRLSVYADNFAAAGVGAVATNDARYLACVTNGGATINGSPITNGASFTITGGGSGGGLSNIVVAGVGGTLTGSGSNVVASVSLASLAGAGILTNGQHNVSLGTNVTMAGSVAVGAIRAVADSATGVVIQTQSGGNNIIIVDTTNKRVGINTTNAITDAFQVDGSFRTRIGSPSPNAAQIQIGYGSTSVNYFDANNHIFRNGAYAEFMRMTNQCVGIGTNAPAAKLHVNGSVRIEGATTNVGELVALGGGNVVTNGGSGASLTGITADQVGAVSTNGGSIAYVDMPVPGTSAGSPAAGAARLESQTVNGQAWINMVQSDGSSFRVLRDTVFSGYNYTGGTLTNGAAVAFGTGMVSTVHWLQLARADSDTTMPAQGIVIGGNITNGGVGNFAFITRTPTGYLSSALSALPYGTPLYVSTTEAGGYQVSEPGPGYYRQPVGYVNLDGAIDVRIEQSDLIENSAINRQWNLWPGSNSTVAAGAKAMRLVNEVVPAGAWTNAIPSNSHYTVFCSTPMGLTVLKGGVYTLNINMLRTSGGGAALSMSAEVYLRATNGVETELTAVSGTTPQTLTATSLEYVYSLSIATDTACNTTDSIEVKLKSSALGGSPSVIIRSGTFTAPIPSGQFALQNDYAAHTAATIAGGIHGGLTAADIAAAGGATGAVYSAESGAPSITNGLLYFPTNGLGTIPDSKPLDESTNYIDVVILAGQSNAEGCPWANYSESPAAYFPYNTTNRSARIWWEDPYRNWHITNEFVHPVTTTNWGSELSFAYKYCEARGWRSNALAIVKVTYGGADLASIWNPTNTTYALLKTTFAMATNTLASQGLAPRFRGFLWMQGESDATSASYANAYFANMTNFIGSVRSEFPSGVGSPFVFGRISNRLRGYETTVRKAQYDVSTNVSNCIMVQTDNLPIGTDLAHYSATGQVMLGQAFCTALSSLGSTAVVTNDLSVKGVMSASAFSGDGAGLSIKRYDSAFEAWVTTNTQSVTSNTQITVQWQGGSVPAWMKGQDGTNTDITFNRTGWVAMNVHLGLVNLQSGDTYALYLYRNGQHYKFGQKLYHTVTENAFAESSWMFYNSNPTNRYQIVVRSSRATTFNFVDTNGIWCVWSGAILPDDTPIQYPSGLKP